MTNMVLVDTKGVECMSSSYDLMQTYHIMGLIGGLALCVAAFFNVAMNLSDKAVVTVHVLTALIAGLALLMCCAAYYTFWRPCVLALGFVPFQGAIGQQNGNVVGMLWSGGMLLNDSIVFLL